MRREKEKEFNWTDEVVWMLLPMRREKEVEFNWTREVVFTL